jgi:TatA/E family protein of Tat protein translocase
MGGFGNPVHIAFVAVIALLVLGPKRLPELARTLGHGMREFRESLNSVTGADMHAPAPPEALGAASAPAAGASAGSPLPPPTAPPPPVPVQPSAAAASAAGPTAPLPAPDAPPAPVPDQPA